MRIASIKSYPLELPLSRPFETNFGRFEVRRVLLVAVSTGDATATAECPVFGPQYSYETVETARLIVDQHIGPAIVGETLEKPEDFVERVAFIRGHPFAKSAVELALWDLWARGRGQPLWRFAGGEREHVRCQISIGVKASIEELLEAIEAGIEQGYGHIKLKIRRGWDAAVLEHVRNVYPDTPLMVDANGGYTLQDLPMLKALDRLNLEMIEQPLHPADLRDHALLQREIATPICLDESVDSIQSAQAAIALGSCRIVNIKLARVGGLGPAKQMASLCRENGLTVWCGGMIETGLGACYNLAAASLPEFVHPNDITQSYAYFDIELVRPPIQLRRDGTIQLPERPGIGRDVDWEMVQRFTTR